MEEDNKQCWQGHGFRTDHPPAYLKDKYIVNLVYGSKKKAMITGRKLRKQVLVAVDEELDKIDEIYTYIENREYAKVDGIYMNWLLKFYKSRIRCFLGIGLYMPYQCFQLFE